MDMEKTGGSLKSRSRMCVLVSVDVVPSLAEAMSGVQKSSTSRIAKVRSSMADEIVDGACCSARQAAQKLGRKSEEFQQGKIWKRMQEKWEKKV